MRMREKRNEQQQKTENFYGTKFDLREWLVCRPAMNYI